MCNFEPALALLKEGFLTCDSRRAERKKFGRAKARRSFQFSALIFIRLKSPRASWLAVTTLFCLGWFDDSRSCMLDSTQLI